jgi:glycosyltransferase involved in cell wall biosynthesis
MTNPKKILLVFPHNFFESESGVQKRFFELVSYLKGRGFSIDLLGLKHFESNWNNFDLENSGKLIDQLYLYNFRTGYHKQLLRSVLSSLKFFLTGKRGQSINEIPDYAFPGMITLFQKTLRKTNYEYVIIGYIYWANLLKKNIPVNTIKVLTAEDFISRKLFENNTGYCSMEDLMTEEIDRVNLFDKVICISYEELQILSARAGNPEFYYVPVFMNEPAKVNQKKEFDILFIGSDNSDNIEGLEWFFKNVYPLLHRDLNILVVGRISRYAPDLSNVKKMDFIPHAGEIYSKVKISVNPLQKGTGMKVKVVESLAYGTPIVSTSRGLCGIPPEILEKFIIANDPTCFAEEIHHLLTDETWYDNQCREAKKIFKSYFETGVVKKQLDKVFSD